MVPYSGPLIEVQQGHARAVEAVNDLSAIARTADGRAWLGGSNGLWQHEQKRFLRVAMPEETQGSEVQAIAGSSADDLWVSVVRKAVYRRKRGVWSAYGGLPALPKSPAITACTEANGRVWFGYPSSQIAMVDGEQARVFGKAEGVTAGVVTALHCQGRHVWGGGDFGLLLWNGQAFRPVLVANKRAFELITGIVETASGDLWLNTAVGIVHVTPAEVAAALADPSYQLAMEVFDRLDGFAGIGARIRPLPTAIEGTDGKLWFASSSGVFWIDPARIRRDLDPPKIVVHGLFADGRQYLPGAPITLPQGTTAVRVDYVGLSLAVPERLQYRYRLEGVDSDWKNVQSQHQAFYTSLRPGSYKFHVTASNKDGVWNETGKTLAFTIAPTFVQTSWFTALCVLAAVGVIVLLFRMRVRQVAARLRWRLDAQLAERDRIARELHDTLLQSTQGLILRFQAVANRIGGDDPNREMLEQALDRADEVLTEGRERVRGLRQPEGTGLNLVQVLGDAGEELTVGSAVSFHLGFEGEERALPAELGHDIYRIAREAIVNALRHAQAKSIEVSVLYSATELSVVVRDDGIGIDAETARTGSRTGHWGLRGMHERAERIGAILQVRQRPEHGTEIELTVGLTSVARNQARP